MSINLKYVNDGYEDNCFFSLLGSIPTFRLANPKGSPPHETRRRQQQFSQAENVSFSWSFQPLDNWNNTIFSGVYLRSFLLLTQLPPNDLFSKLGLYLNLSKTHQDLFSYFRIM